jgi:hypothetical protein
MGHFPTLPKRLELRFLAEVMRLFVLGPEDCPNRASKASTKRGAEIRYAARYSFSLSYQKLDYFNRHL